jgi:hypothetical protein
VYYVCFLQSRLQIGGLLELSHQRVQVSVEKLPMKDKELL